MLAQGAVGTAPTSVTPPPPIPLQKMGAEDDSEAFIELFEHTAEACCWSEDQWAVWLIPLLSGEAQLAARQVPLQSLLTYKDLKKAILQRVGHSPEQHHQRFRSPILQECGHSFAFAQQFREACKQCFLPEDHDTNGVVDVVVLGQFSMHLPKETAEWVQCHQPASLETAIQLAEDHLASYGGSSSSLSHSLFPLPPDLSPLLG